MHAQAMKYYVLYVEIIIFLFCFVFRSVAISKTRKGFSNACQENEDCIPAEYNNVPSTLISCNTSTGLCECNECFIRLRDVCQLNNKTCEKFDDELPACTDDRRSQKKALLLSTFLSSTGAANFYIGQNILGLLCGHDV